MYQNLIKIVRVHFNYFKSFILDTPFYFIALYIWDLRLIEKIIIITNTGNEKIFHFIFSRFYVYTINILFICMCF